MRRTLALCLLVLSAIATNAFAVGEARLTGKITDAVTKNPIPDAKVTVTATEAFTFKQSTPAKKDGTYAIFLIRGEVKYEFLYEAPGYQPYKEVSKLKLGEPNVRDIMLTPVTAAAAPTPEQVKATAKADPAVAAYNEGAELANDGKDEEAIKKFEEAVAAKPELTAGWEALAKLYFRTKKYQKAIDAATKALAADPEASDMNAVLYEAYGATGNAAKAAEYKKKMPQSAPGLYNDAAKLLNAGKDAEAEPLLKQAIGIDEKFAPAYYQLGMIYAKAGKNADAKTNLQKYLELDPKGSDAATAKEMLSYVSK